MTITSDLKKDLNDLTEKYHKVVKLIKDEVNSNPTNKLFNSKFAAEGILISMKTSIENILNNYDNDCCERKNFCAMLGIVHIFLGTIYIEIEETSMAEKHLIRCLEVIDGFKEEYEYINITLNVYNQFGILWFKNEPEKGKLYLTKSMELYEKNKNHQDPPKSFDDLFRIDSKVDNSEESWKSFEKICTATYYYLAQIYGSLQDDLKSAVYCHITLKRQLIYNEFEFIDWCLNAATLSQFFAEQKGFKQARHHLSAASLILSRYKEELEKIEIHDDLYESKMEEFNHRRADVARCWAQYGSILLSKSKERLLEEAEKDEPKYLPSSTDLVDIVITSESTVSKDDLSNLNFPSLDLEKYENQVTADYILTLKEAKDVFLNAQKWLLQSQEYYTLDNSASDHIDINLSLSQLYLHLLFFDDNADNQAKYQKRRINLMENLLKKINSLFYLSHCRKMWYEVGNAYINLLDIKLDKQRESSSSPTANSLLKINNIITKGIKYFTIFLESFKDPSQLKNYLMVYARAQFYIGVLLGKYITLDKKKKLENVEASLVSYRQVLEFCEKYPDAKEQIMMEFGVCKEMVELLPAKIMILQNEIGIDKTQKSN